MNHETRRAIALWRMSVLGPLVSMDLEHGDLRPLLAAAATRTYETPQGRRVRPRWRTLEAWYYAYKHGGLKALEPATRKDTGTCRALPEALAQHILALRREQPRRSVRTLVRAVERAGMCRIGETSASSVLRLLRAHDLSQRPSASPARLGERGRQRIGVRLLGDRSVGGLRLGGGSRRRDDRWCARRRCGRRGCGRAGDHEQRRESRRVAAGEHARGYTAPGRDDSGPGRAYARCDEPTMESPRIDLRRRHHRIPVDRAAYGRQRSSAAAPASEALKVWVAVEEALAGGAAGSASRRRGMNSSRRWADGCARISLVLADERGQASIDVYVVNTAAIILHLESTRPAVVPPPKPRFDRDSRSRG